MCFYNSYKFTFFIQTNRNLFYIQILIIMVFIGIIMQYALTLLGQQSLGFHVHTGKEKHDYRLLFNLETSR